jgi:hypothetical protein
MPINTDQVKTNPEAVDVVDMDFLNDEDDMDQTTTAEVNEADGSHTLLIKNSQGVVVGRKKNHNWQKAADGLNVMAEVSNFGIFIKVVSAWIPAIQALGAGAIGMMAAFTDPMIYFFRSLIRVTRVVGREFFGIVLDDEENGAHKHQTKADIVSLILFSLAIPLFFGLIIASPIGITVAWGLAISGLGVAGYFDYAYPAKRAKEKYEALKIDPAASPQDVANALKDFEIKQTAKRFFFSLIFGVGLLVLCTSAAVFAPPMIIPALFILSKVASALLGLIAVGRFVNSRRAKEADLKAAEELAAQEQLTEELDQDVNNDMKATNDNILTSSAKITKSIKPIDGSSLSRHADLAEEKRLVAPTAEIVSQQGKKASGYFFSNSTPYQTQNEDAVEANELSYKVGGG